MIRNPNEILDKEKLIRILIAGFPGIGKSTIGLSAPDPLHIDVDFGIDRVDARYRKAFIQPSTYEEILSDLVPENLKPYKTLVFDTGGKLLELMKPWAIKNDMKNGKRDGSLSLAGYGTVGREFVRLMDYCFYELKKHIVILFHAKEEKESENTKLRLMIEGGTKDTVWQPMDLGGFMEMYGNDRTIGFSNCEKYYAKGTRGIKGVRKIPELTEKTPNDFLAKLFEEYNAIAAKEIEVASADKKKYNAAIKESEKILETVVDVESATAATAQMKKIKHALTSEEEVREAFKGRLDEVGIAYNKAKKCYVQKESPEDTEVSEAAE